MFLEQRREADARPAEQLGGEHGVKDALGAKTVEVVQQPQIEIAAVHQEVFPREAAE